MHKYYFYGFILLLLLACSAYLSRQWTLDHLPPRDNTDVIEANSKLQLAENSLELIRIEKEKRDSLVAILRRQLLSQHYEDIPREEEFIDSINNTIEIILDAADSTETRIAKTMYSFTDLPNNYSLDLSIEYVYKTHKFKIVPLERKFEPVKVYQYAVNIFARPDEIGLRLDADWKFIRFGGGISSNLEPEVSFGIKF